MTTENTKRDAAAVLNEVALPRVEDFREDRLMASLSKLVNLARGAPGNLPGATAKDVRDELGNDLFIRTLVDLMGDYSKFSQRAALAVAHAVATPDVIVDDEKSWHPSTDTSRQHLLGQNTAFLQALVTWLQRATEKHKNSEETSVVICQCVRSLCIDPPTAAKMNDAEAVPPLLILLRRHSQRKKTSSKLIVQAAAGALVALSIWRPQIVAFHGGIPLLIDLLSRLRGVARLSATQIIAQIVQNPPDARKVLEHGGLLPIFHLAALRRSDPVLATTREAALWCLVRIATSSKHRIAHPVLPRIILRALQSERSRIRHAGLVLFKLVVPEDYYWAPHLQDTARPFVAASLEHSEPVRVAAADIIATVYTTNTDRLLIALGQEPTTGLESGLPDVDLDPDGYHTLVYGTPSVSDKKKKKKKRRDDDMELPAARLYVYDEDEIEAIQRGGRIKKSKDPKVPREVQLTNFQLSWQTRGGDETFFVAGEDIQDCHPATTEVLTSLGYPPETLDVETSFIVRSRKGVMLFGSVADAVNLKKRSSVEKSRSLRAPWIERFLTLRDAAAKANFSKSISKKKKNGYSSITPRLWEDLVAHPVDAPKREKGHPDVLGNLFTMALEARTKTDVAMTSLEALMNLCLHPGINRHVRETYEADILEIPSTIRAFLDEDNQVAVKKLELLVLFRELDLLDENVSRLNPTIRATFRKVVINWRRHLGYKALDVVRDQFDAATLRRLEETFAEIDEDGSGYISASELGNFFTQKMKTRLSKKQLREIVEEVDVDGNGVVDFEEFLLVVKNMKSMRSIQSKLGVALQGGGGNFLDLTKNVVFASKKKKKMKMKQDLEVSRMIRSEDEELALEDQVRQLKAVSLRYRLDRKQRANQWHFACRETFRTVSQDNLMGRVTLDGAFRLLLKRRDLLDNLGFVYKDTLALVKVPRFKEEYDGALNAVTYDALCACAEELDNVLTYPDFESTLFRVVSQYRKNTEEDPEESSEDEEND